MWKNKELTGVEIIKLFSVNQNIKTSIAHIIFILYMQYIYNIFVLYDILYILYNFMEQFK